MGSFFRRVAQNWKLKTLALALAVLLWVVVTSGQVASNWFSVPLEIQLNDPDYQLTGVQTRDVEVLFSGPRNDLLEVVVRRPPLRLVIDEVTSEDATFQLSPRMVSMPGQFAVNAVDVRPSTVQLQFARVDSRMIPVRVRMNDLLGRDWALVDSLSPEPAAIRVTGPPQRVAAATEIFTETVGVIPEDTLFERVVALDTTGFQGLQLSSTSVRVRGVLDRVVERGFTDVPVDIGGGVTIRPDRVYVVVRGVRRVVQDMTRQSFRVVVAIDSIPASVPPEGLPVPVRLQDLPRGVRGTVEPNEVRIYPREREDAASASPAPGASPLGGDPVAAR